MHYLFVYLTICCWLVVDSCPIPYPCHETFWNKTRGYHISIILNMKLCLSLWVSSEPDCQKILHLLHVGILRWKSEVLYFKVCKSNLKIKLKCKLFDFFKKNSDPLNAYLLFKGSCKNGSLMWKCFPGAGVPPSSLRLRLLADGTGVTFMRRCLFLLFAL